MPRIVTPPPPIIEVIKEKRGKKGKGTFLKQIYYSSIYEENGCPVGLIIIIL